MLAFGPADIARVIDAAALARGRAVHADGRAIDVAISNRGALMLEKMRRVGRIAPLHDAGNRRPGLRRSDYRHRSDRGVLTNRP